MTSTVSKLLLLYPFAMELAKNKKWSSSRDIAGYQKGCHPNVHLTRPSLMSMLSAGFSKWSDITRNDTSLEYCWLRCAAMSSLSLLPLTVEELNCNTANTHDQARVDIAANDWCNKQMAFFDVKVLNPFAKSNRKFYCTQASANLRR